MFLSLNSLIFLPYLYGLKPADFALIISFLLLLYIFLIKGKIVLVSKISFLFFIISTLYFLITNLGAVINAPESFLYSFLVSIRYIVVISSVFLIFLIFEFNTHKLKKIFVLFCNGFILSAIINVVWIFLDNIFYYFITPFRSINEIIFNNINLNLEHGLTNRFLLNDFYLLRSSGLGWDPGGIGPALLIALIISDILGKSFKIRVLLIIGIIMTLSRTAILSLLLYIILKYAKNIMRIRLNTLINFGIILYLLIVNALILIPPDKLGEYFKEGTVRHLKYFSEIYNIVYSTPKEILIGYGYRGTGEFFNKNVSWLYDLHNFYFKKNGIPESTLTNLFLYGGILGALYNIVLYFFLLVYEQKFKIVIFFLLILYFGYSFENIWNMFIVYYLAFLNTIKIKRNCNINK